MKCIPAGNKSGYLNRMKCCECIERSSPLLLQVLNPRGGGTPRKIDKKCMCLCNLLLPKQASTLSQLEILSILTMSTPTVKVALEIFPTNVAVELKMFAEKITLYYAKVCRGKQITEAEGDRIEACRHRAYFKEKCKGWLSEKTWLEIEKMFVHASCHAANIRKSETCWRRGNRKGYENDANVPVKSKLQHPPHRAYPGHLTPFLAREGGNLITTHRGWGI